MRGIDKFKERFAGHDGEYVLIGGGACVWNSSDGWPALPERFPPSASIGYTSVIVKSPRAFSGCGYLYLQPHFSYLLEPIRKIPAPRQHRNGRSSTPSSRSATSRTEGSASS